LGPKHATPNREKPRDVAIEEGEQQSVRQKNLLEKAKRPWRDMKIQIATCQAIAMARRYGWTIAVGEEDINCPLTKTAFGRAPLTDHYTSGRQLALISYRMRSSFTETLRK
jgi:uncharacterized protein (DUF169 family)